MDRKNNAELGVAYDAELDTDNGAVLSGDNGSVDDAATGVSDPGITVDTELSATDVEQLQSMIARYPSERRYALAAMQDIQRAFDYLPRASLELLAKHLGCPLVQLYSMATFYKALSLKPKGRHIIKVCDGTACHIKGSINLVDGIERVLGIRPGEVTDDGQFSVETVNCLGSCALAPVLLVDDTHFGKVTLEQLPQLFDAYRQGGEQGDAA